MLRWGIWKLRIPTGGPGPPQQEPGDGLAVRWGHGSPSTSVCQLKVQSTHRGETQPPDTPRPRDLSVLR